MIGWAVCLLILGVGLIVLEFVVLSMGLLSLMAILSIAASIYFAVSDGFGVGVAFSVCSLAGACFAI